jgi:stage II sporulation protein R
MHIKTNKRHGALILTLAFLLAALILLGTTYLPVHGEEQIYDAVIRLHVLANSDSEQDQALKLQVRDAVLSVTTEALEGCADRAEAERRLHALLPALITAAEQSLRESGCEDKVTVALGQEDYPTRNYDSFCFPSGEYLSLRVMIGEARGQNFWCVLFPPLCTEAANAKEELLESGFTQGQIKILTEADNPRYVLRFKALEVWESWKESFR